MKTKTGRKNFTEQMAKNFDKLEDHQRIMIYNLVWDMVAKNLLLDCAYEKISRGDQE